MRMKFVTAISLFLLVGTASAQKTLIELPDKPEPGKCYVKCVTPDVYEYKDVQVMIKPAYKKLETVPAEYKTVEEKILVKPASKRLVPHPAQFETYTEEMQTEDPRNELSVVPATFKDAKETIETNPKVGRWEYRPVADCVSKNPGDCQMLCWVEHDAQYMDVPKKLLDSPARTNTKKVGGKSTKITKQRLVKDAWVEEIAVPAEYKTIAKRVLVKDETTREVEVPAAYTTQKVQILKAAGGVTVWEEVDCKLTEANILPIFYELNSARLTPESKRIIDEKLYTLMTKQPNIKIELSSHTDSRGSAEDNMDLSERRAQSVVDYLINKGINPSRLVARGFGETRLVNNCADGVPCTEEQHQQNRRTEFRVLNY